MPGIEGSNTPFTNFQISEYKLNMKPENKAIRTYSNWGLCITYQHICMVFGARSEYLGCCRNYGPSWGSYSNTAPIIWGTQKGTLILTTAHLEAS